MSRAEEGPAGRGIVHAQETGGFEGEGKTDDAVTRVLPLAAGVHFFGQLGAVVVWPFDRARAQFGVQAVEQAGLERAVMVKPSA